METAGQRSPITLESKRPGFHRIRGASTPVTRHGISSGPAPAIRSTFGLSSTVPVSVGVIAFTTTPLTSRDGLTIAKSCTR